MPAVNFRPMKIGIWIIADEKSPLHGGLIKFGLPHPSNAKCVMITVRVLFSLNSQIKLQEILFKIKKHYKCDVKMNDLRFNKAVKHPLHRSLFFYSMTKSRRLPTRGCFFYNLNYVLL